MSFVYCSVDAGVRFFLPSGAARYTRRLTEAANWKNCWWTPSIVPVGQEDGEAESRALQMLLQDIHSLVSFFPEGDDNKCPAASLRTAQPAVVNGGILT